MSREARRHEGTKARRADDPGAQAIADRCKAARRVLEFVGQAHVLARFDGLDAAAQDRLLSQIESIDWDEVADLIESHVRRAPRVSLPRHIEPAPLYPNEPTGELPSKYAEARRLGEELVRDGKVAAFTVAGGQGTRLGWDAPKGTFAATPVRHLSLFEVMAQFIQKVQRKYRTVVPWYILTSPANDADTRRFFQQHEHFALDPSHVMLFAQGMMPAIGMVDSKVLLAAPDSLALSPNGHGGSLRALHRSGALDDMLKRGIEHISYTQIDNPHVRVVDPLFVGLHGLDGCRMSSKAVLKTRPDEKVGVFCVADGKLTVIEYSDMPADMLEARDDHGLLRFSAGSIAIHAIRVDFVAALNRDGGAGLPFHRAEKKVPFFDPESGRTVQPDEPNAVKLEMFVFDALPLCDRSIVYETDRVEEFAPIKNADAPKVEDSVDSPATSRRLQTQRAARWLESHGVRIPRTPKGRVDATIEVTHLTAVEAADLGEVELPDSIEPGSEVVI